jgi:hypothetical protein
MKVEAKKFEKGEQARKYLLNDLYMKYLLNVAENLKLYIKYIF